MGGTCPHITRFKVIGTINDRNQMISADALRRVLYTDVAKDDGVRSGLRFHTAYDGPLLQSVAFENPAATQPRSMFRFSMYVLGTSAFGCLTMRARNKEKWWLGLFGVTVMYFSALKGHKVDNGLVGHQLAFFADAMLVIGCFARLLVRSGSPSFNLALLGVGSSLAWFDLGRFHLWSDYVAQLRREVSPERSLDLLDDYVPEDIDTEFMFFRPAKTKGT